MGGALLVVLLGASPFLPVDGGFLSQSRLPVPHRTIEVFAPASAMTPLIVSDGDAPGTHLPFLIETAAEPELADAGAVIYPGISVTVPSPLTLRIESSGPLTIRLPRAASRTDGNTQFIDSAAASFALLPSTAFEDLGGYRLRVNGTFSRVDIQLQVSGPPVPWPLHLGTQSCCGNLVWDAARARLTRFGGSDAFEFDPDTYVWDTILGWQRLPIASPPPRLRATLVYDSIRQRLVLFGGLGPNGSLNDTWEFDGSQWLDVTPSTGPSARWSHGAAFDQTTGTMILFGGLTSQVFSELGDTWSWDGFTWTQLQPATSPSARDAFGMTWDGTRGRITLVAGWDGQSTLGDVWIWVNGSWQQQGNAPGPARASTALAWSQLTGHLLLVGGWLPRDGDEFYFGDVWSFDGTTWTQEQDLPRPTARLALASHPSMGVMMFGGRYSLSGYLAETALLEPAWRRLQNGDVEDRGLVLDSATVVGQSYAWKRSGGSWDVTWRVPRDAELTPVGALVVAVQDGGMRTFDVQTGSEITSPPAFQLAGRSSPWVLDLDGGLHRYEDVPQTGQPSWVFVGNAPPLVRALAQRRAGTEYLAWTDGLGVWTPADGGLIPFGNPLSVDGGFVLTSTEWSTAIVTDESGSWHLSTAGVWEHLELPRLAEAPLDGRTIPSDAGLGRYEFLKPQGARCEGSIECATQSCVNGRCCDRACTSACEVCSRAAGSQLDGVCRPAPAGTVCLETSCGPAICNGIYPTCSQYPPPCDAGTEPEEEPVEVPRDAGRTTRDAGTVVIGEPEPAPGCGCHGLPGAVWWLAAIWVARSRRRR